MPGYQDALVIGEAHLGVRETRRIVGEYVLNKEDIMEGRQFSDSIALGSYYIDVHNPANVGSSCVLSGTTYGIPYRCLIPRDIDGLLVAGQTISMTYMAHEPGPCRGMVPCTHWGQATGTAAALAVKQGVSIRDVDIPTLRTTLESQGVNLDKKAIDLTEVNENIKRRGSKITHVA